MQEANASSEHSRHADPDVGRYPLRSPDDRGRLEALESRLSEIEASTTWRGTEGLRRIGIRFPAVARLLSVTIHLLLWQELPATRARRQPKAGAPASQALYSSPGEVLGGDALVDEPVGFAPSAEPVVSVVIPTYGQIETTLACLRSLARFPPGVPFEVIVVDDAYPNSGEIAPLLEIPGIVLIHNAVNLGFLKTCNEAASKAKGRYLYLLNNDTELRQGSIDALLGVLKARIDVGLVGSKLIFPNGELQEAGGIVWRDASAWNYGRGASPSRPDFEYVREVDYCSGASILIERDLWLRLRGFDEQFSPAYYEDVDLAFRVREEGLRVVYEPRSVVVHHEGVSHGHDLTRGAKANLPTNQRKFEARWRLMLQQHFANGERALRARDRAWRKRLMLVVDHFPPEFDRDAGSRSTLGIIESLIADGWVLKFWPLNRLYHPRYTANLEQMGVEVIDQRNPVQFDEWIQENGMELDHVLVIRPDVAEAVLPSLVTGTDAALSYYGVDLHFERMTREAIVMGDPQLLAAAREMEARERRIWRRFDLLLYPSEEEAAAIRARNADALVRAIVPFHFEVWPAADTAPSDRSLLFVAGFAHPPNVDAARFLVREILPQITRDFGPIRVTLAGSNPTADVLRLASDTVAVTGYVTDSELEALYRSHRVACVPLRFGAGVKGKVVEALCRGVPLVTTSTGAQGIPGLLEAAIVHDEPKQIAAELGRLLADDVAWLDRSRRQREFAQRHFSKERMQESVRTAFEQLEASIMDRRLPWEEGQTAQMQDAPETGTPERYARV